MHRSSLSNWFCSLAKFRRKPFTKSFHRAAGPFAANAQELSVQERISPQKVGKGAVFLQALKGGALAGELPVLMENAFDEAHDATRHILFELFFCVRATRSVHPAGNNALATYPPEIVRCYQVMRMARSVPFGFFIIKNLFANSAKRKFRPEFMRRCGPAM